MSNQDYEEAMLRSAAKHPSFAVTCLAHAVTAADDTDRKGRLDALGGKGRAFGESLLATLAEYEVGNGGGRPTLDRPN